MEILCGCQNVIYVNCQRTCNVFLVCASIFDMKFSLGHWMRCVDFGACMDVCASCQGMREVIRCSEWTGRNMPLEVVGQVISLAECI